MLDLKTSYNFERLPDWESRIVDIAKKSFWIGVDKPTLETPKNDEVLHIPNFYEFTRNYDVTDNNKVGFAITM